MYSKLVNHSRNFVKFGFEILTGNYLILVECSKQEHSGEMLC